MGAARQVLPEALGQHPPHSTCLHGAAGICPRRLACEHLPACDRKCKLVDLAGGKRGEGAWSAQPCQATLLPCPRRCPSNPHTFSDDGAPSNSSGAM